MDATSRGIRSVVTARPGAAADVASRLRADPRILSVVPDAAFTLTAWPADGIPDDPDYADQPNLGQIGVPGAWTTSIGDASVVVAVLDTGVDLTHPDLDGVTVVAPRDVFWNSTEVTDEVGHGTHVAGTIVAETNNGVGVAGIAPASTLMPVRITSGQSLSFSDALDGVDWARTHGADIISMSFGGTLTSEQVALGQPTFTAAREAGILLVAASGNDGRPARNYPASFNGVVSVGAVDVADELAEFSTTGTALDIVAPGVDVLSTLPDGDYETLSGTSMAAPHVAGVAALVWAARPTLGVAQLEAILRTSTVDLGEPGHDKLYGDGRVDAAAAMVAPVPDPLPGLEPPLPLPALQLSFDQPAADVRQSGSTYLVKLAVNHEVVDGIALSVAWPIVKGACREDVSPTLGYLDFGLEIPLTGLRQGRCYEVIVAAIDEDGNYAEAMSPTIMVVDPTIPRIIHRSPGGGATGVSPSANVRIRFSETVSAAGLAVRLRNVKTGLIVRTTKRWVASTHTLVLDPVLRMYPGTRYRVEVTAQVQDRGGNSVRPTAWFFKTGR
jgi:hypothetical protein